MSKTLRIGYVAKMFPRLSETFVLNEILELERQGVEVVVFSAKKPNEGRFHPQLAELKAPILYLEDHDPKKWAGWMAKDWDALRGSRDRIFELVDEALVDGDTSRIDRIWQGAWIAARSAELGLDRLHSHFATLPAMLAHMANRVGGIPYSFTAHAKDIFVYTPEETRLRDLIGHADFMVTVTEYNRRHLLGLMPDVDPAKIQVVYNGIDLDSFVPVPAAERRDDLILGVGRLVPKKGFDVLLRACDLLRTRGVDFRCIIAGGGVDAGVLEALHAELALEDRVEFVGPLKVDRVRELMREAAVFALPCQAAGDGNLDALPTVLLESLASALPVVSTDVSGVPEIATDGLEGLLVPPEDPESLADALEKLLTDSALRTTCGEAGRAKAEAAFDLRKSVGRMKELFSTGGVPARSQSASSDSRGRRLLYLCADKGIAFGGTKGASIHVREFLDAAVAAGHEPVAVVRKTSGADGRPPSCRIETFSLPDGVPAPKDSALAECEEYARNASFASQLDDLHDECGFDMVYERYSLFGIAGLEFARRSGLPFVLEVNAPLVEEASEHRGLWLADAAREAAARLFSQADLVVAVSEAVRNHVLSVAPDARVEVVPNGVDTTRVVPTEPTADGRRKVGGNEGDFVVGFVGRIRPWHGVEVLIEALALARAEASDVKLCVVGEERGAGTDLRALCRDKGVDDAVVFLGAVSPAEVPGLLDAFDAFAAPYPELDHFYFSPLKLYEAMAAGKAIVASDAGQISDVIDNGRTGLLVEPGDAGALARALLDLRNDPARSATMGSAARETAVTEHDWSLRISGIMDLVAADRARTVKAS